MNARREAVAQKRSFVAFGLVCLFIGSVAVVRLAAVVAATPAARLLVDTPQLVDPALPVSERTRARADFLSHLVSDAKLAPAILAACTTSPGATEGSEEASASPVPAACLDAIDGVLDAAPYSGELWLYRAAVLVSSGDVGPDAMTALRRSYLTTRREGWIASGRVVLGLRLYPLLPADLRQSVRGDLAIVAANPALAAPVIAAYRTDVGLHRVVESTLGPLPALVLDDYVARRGNPLS